MPYPTKKLGEVIEIIYGKGLPKDSRVDSGKYFAYGSNGPVYGTDESLTNGETIIIGRKGTAGALYFVSEPCWPIDTTFFAKPKNDASLKFVYYFLRTKRLPKLAIVTGVPGINRTTLANIDVQLPPLGTQKQIVERMDKIAEAQKLNDGLIQKTDELFQSLLHKELNLVRDSKHSNGANPVGRDWEVKKLGDLAELITKGTTPTTYGRQFTNTGTPFLRAEDVNNSVVDFSRVQYHISEETNKFLSRSQTKANDILITIAGTIGRVGYVPENAPMMNMNQAVAIVRLNKITNFMYVFFLLQNKELRRKMFGAQVTGTISNLSNSNIGNLKIPLPPIEMQKQIVAKLSAVQKYKQRLIEQRKKLKELFDSVLRKSMINK